MCSSGFHIQPDWDKAILEKDRQFWFHVYDAGKTHFRKVFIKSDSLEPDLDDVACCIVSSKAISFEDRAKRMQTTFQCSDVKFSAVHKIQRQPSLHVNSFDVNASGQLAVSAASDNSVFLWETKTGDIRRSFVGHASEVYTCRFFPSGLVVVTGGADMQLKIWSVINGECATSLRPGIGGADGPVDKEPGGHRSGVIDVDFIDRGKNLVSLDRGGWLRLWDVATQIAISAISVVPNRNGGRAFANCPLEYEPVCCSVKNCTWPVSRTLGFESAKPSDCCGNRDVLKVLETESNRAVAAGVTDKLVAVGTGNDGLLCAIDLSSAETRKFGPVFQLQMPDGSGAVTACTFARSLQTDGSNQSASSLPQSSDLDRLLLNENELGVPSEFSSVFDEFGIVAGGETGQVAFWDLRNSAQPVLIYDHGKSGVTKLITHRCQAHKVYGPSDETISVPAFTGLLIAQRDGRVILQPVDQTKSAANGKSIGVKRLLELTGPDVDAIRGLSILPGDAYGVGAWTATNSGSFYYYRRLAIHTLYYSPFIA